MNGDIHNHQAQSPRHLRTVQRPIQSPTQHSYDIPNHMTTTWCQVYTRTPDKREPTTSEITVPYLNGHSRTADPRQAMSVYQRVSSEEQAVTLAVRCTVRTQHIHTHSNTHVRAHTHIRSLFLHCRRANMACTCPCHPLVARTRANTISTDHLPTRAMATANADRDARVVAAAAACSSASASHAVIATDICNAARSSSSSSSSSSSTAATISIHDSIIHATGIADTITTATMDSDNNKNRSWGLLLALTAPEEGGSGAISPVDFRARHSCTDLPCCLVLGVKNKYIYIYIYT